MTLLDTKERIRSVASLLHRATGTVRILTHIAWPQHCGERFLANRAYKLPAISYPPFDTSETLAHLAAARRLIHDDSDIDHWLTRTADRIESSARLLSACGTPEFLEHSRALYGIPKDTLRDGSATPLGLAKRFSDTIKSISNVDLGIRPPVRYQADYVAERMTEAATKMFGARAPAVQVVDHLSANALAGPTRIRIRRGASFTDNDIAQLIHHEAYVHVATSLNGIDQADLPILGASHPGSTRTQEGLAVFAEFISGSLDIDRFQRLADRVIATQMAIDGADFVEVFRYFLDHADHHEQAFENARRVFRGGVPDGGIPFTKDIVYLDGLLRVHNFLRVVVASGRLDCLQLLFCGKIDLEDMPVLCELSAMGLCRPPRYLPPWVADRRFLLTYLVYSSYLNGIDLGAVRNHYSQLLASSAPTGMRDADYGVDDGEGHREYTSEDKKREPGILDNLTVALIE